MLQLVVSKYNPKYRDKNGVYLKDEWTSLMDIGTTFNGVVFTRDEYLRVENAYIDICYQSMKLMKINSLEIREIEWNGYANLELKKNKLYYDIFKNKKIQNGMMINREDVAKIIKLALRNVMWCVLVHPKKIIISFGYEYYLFLGINMKHSEFIKKIESPLFFESKNFIDDCEWGDNIKKIWMADRKDDMGDRHSF